MTEKSESDSTGDGNGITADGKVFARKGDASTLGFAVVTGPRVDGPPAPLREMPGPRHGLLLSALIALVLSPILVWGAFAVLERVDETPLVRVAPPPGAVLPAAEVALRPAPAVETKVVLTPDIWVQLHAFDSKEVAARAATRLGKTHSDLLNGLRVHVATARKSGGKPIYRLQAGAFADAKSARDLCNRAQKRQLACVVLAPVFK